MIGLQGESSWLYDVPYAIRSVLNWVTKRYNRPPIYMTENGCDCPGENTDPLPGVLNDTFRINFYEGYLNNVLMAVNEDGCDVRSYHAWSLTDNFEWADGYSKRFGLNYVDYDNNLTRHRKQSSYWYSDFIKQHPDGH
jgi:beta-glucosidase